jgi:hypothetical protein
MITAPEKGAAAQNETTDTDPSAADAVQQAPPQICPDCGRPFADRTPRSPPRPRCRAEVRP